MENLTLCEVCIHAPVCGKLIAVGPLTECEHFYGVGTYAEKLPAAKPEELMMTEMCGRCSCLVLKQDCICPGCGSFFKQD